MSAPVAAPERSVSGPPTSTLPMFFDAAHEALAAEVWRAFHDEDAALFAPGRVIPRLAELGFLQLLVPSNLGGGAWGHDGTGLDVRALCILREALAYVSPIADSIVAVQGLGSYPIVLSGNPGPHARVLAEVVRGERVAAFALTEPEAGSDIASMKTVARLVDGGYELHGEKVFISNVGIAAHYLVFANAAPELGKKGISCFLVPKDTPGLTEERIPLSGHHPLGRLRLATCRVPKSALVGDVGQGLRLALGTLDTFRTSVGAAAVGMAMRALDEALRHVRSRVQFGKPLAEFQLVQGKLAEMTTELDAARLLVYRAAWAKDHNLRDASISVAKAKLFATEAAQHIVDAAVQLTGGLGVVLGQKVEELYREVRPLRIYEGTTEIQKLIIGGHLATLPMAPESDAPPRRDPG